MCSVPTILVSKRAAVLHKERVLVGHLGIASGEMAFPGRAKYHQPDVNKMGHSFPALGRGYFQDP